MARATDPGAAGRRLLRGVAVATALGGFAADWNRTHLFNPAWPPHAKLHDAWTVVLGAALGGTALWLLRDGGGRDVDGRDLALGALLPAMFWAGQGAAFAFPGTDGLAAEFPELVPRVGCVLLDERVASAVVLSQSAVGYALARRGRR
jgi:hypothetical protein